jgi:protein gp37
MAKKTAIEWTEMTWNPVTGCTKVSPGCKHCYAETMAKRLVAMGSPRYRDGFKVTLQDDLIDLPRRWRAPRTIFVNSMSDLFHDAIPTEYIARVFRTMVDCSQHTFQILTKRAERLAQLAPRLPWAPNIWMGISVENQDYVSRIAHLRQVPAFVRFLSIEPMLGPITDLPLEGIHWVIVGGESGRGARPLQRDWVVSVFRQCRAARVPFFFKQWGGVHKQVTGRKIFGRTYDEMPRAPMLSVQSADVDRPEERSVA